MLKDGRLPTEGIAKNCQEVLGKSWKKIKLDFHFLQSQDTQN